MLDPPARGDSIMLSGGMTPGLSPNERTAYSQGVDRGYIVPSDSDEVRRVLRLDSGWSRFVVCV